MLPIQFHYLHTPRLLLRVLTPELWSEVHQQSSEAELVKFFGIQNEKGLAEERKRFAEGMTGYRRSFVNFYLIDKSSEQVIGACGFHTWHTLHHRAEIGYAIFEEGRKNRGYMREALPVVIRYGFEEMDLNRIEAFIGRENEASQRLVRRLWFLEEGVMRAHYCKDGHTEDSIIFSLLRDEWQSSAG